MAQARAVMPWLRLNELGQSPMSPPCELCVCRQRTVRTGVFLSCGLDIEQAMGLWQRHRVLSRRVCSTNCSWSWELLCGSRLCPAIVASGLSTGHILYWWCEGGWRERCFVSLGCSLEPEAAWVVMAGVLLLVIVQMLCQLNRHSLSRLDDLQFEILPL